VDKEATARDVLGLGPAAADMAATDLTAARS
jgi:hypothetical protein